MLRLKNQSRLLRNQSRNQNRHRKGNHKGNNRAKPIEHKVRHRVNLKNKQMADKHKVNPKVKHKDNKDNSNRRLSFRNDLNDRPGSRECPLRRDRMHNLPSVLPHPRNK